MGNEIEFYTAIENAAKAAKLMSKHKEINFDILEKLLTRLSPGSVIGLADGTCEPYQMPNLIQNDYLINCFENVQQGKVVIPTAEGIRVEMRHCMESYKLNIPEALVSGSTKILKIFRAKRGLTKQSCVDFAISEKAILAGMEGLAIARISRALDDDRNYHGIVQRYNLLANKEGHFRMPYLWFVDDGRGDYSPRYGTRDWFEIVKAGECIILYYDA